MWSKFEIIEMSDWWFFGLEIDFGFLVMFMVSNDFSRAGNCCFVFVFFFSDI